LAHFWMCFVMFRKINVSIHISFGIGNESLRECLVKPNHDLEVNFKGVKEKALKDPMTLVPRRVSGIT
jgi:hypothetical protein